MQLVKHLSALACVPQYLQPLQVFTAHPQSISPFWLWNSCYWLFSPEKQSKSRGVSRHPVENIAVKKAFLNANLDSPQVSPCWEKQSDLNPPFSPLHSPGHLSYLFSRVEQELGRGDGGRIFPITILFMNWPRSFLTGRRIFSWEQWVSWRTVSGHVFSHPRSALAASSFALPAPPSFAWGCTWTLSAPHGGTMKNRNELRVLPSASLERVWNHWISAHYWCPDLPFFPGSFWQLYPDGGFESPDCARQQELFSLWLKNHIEQRPELGTSFLHPENFWRTDKMTIFISVDLRAFWED